MHPQSYEQTYLFCELQNFQQTALIVQSHKVHLQLRLTLPIHKCTSTRTCTCTRTHTNTHTHTHAHARTRLLLCVGQISQLFPLPLLCAPLFRRVCVAWQRGCRTGPVCYAASAPSKRVSELCPSLRLLPRSLCG